MDHKAMARIMQQSLFDLFVLIDLLDVEKQTEIEYE